MENEIQISLEKEFGIKAKIFVIGGKIIIRGLKKNSDEELVAYLFTHGYVSCLNNREHQFKIYVG